mgnify:CR=1 FL=1
MPKILLDAGSSGINGAHSTETGLRCQRLKGLEAFHREHEADGEVPANQDGPLVRGSLWHVGLAHHYAHLSGRQQQFDTSELYLPAAAIELAGAKMGATSELVAEVKDGFECYLDFWANDTLEVVDVECLVAEKVTPQAPWLKAAVARVGADTSKWVHTQRLDLVYKKLNGKVWIGDHKCVSRLKQDTIDRYVLSTQFLGFRWFGAKLFGNDFGGVEVNFIEHGKGSSFRFVREVLPPSPFAQTQFEDTVCWERLQRELIGDAPMVDRPGAHSEQGCITPYGKCSMFEVCTWGPSRLTTLNVKKTMAAGVAQMVARRMMKG